MPEFENKGPQGANRDGEMKPRTGPQPLAHRRPGKRVIKSKSLSTALDDYLHNNPGGFDLHFYARRYGVSIGSLMRLWREKMKGKEEEKKKKQEKKKKKKKKKGNEALDGDEETMGSSSNETPPALARPTTTTRPERQSLAFPKPGKIASRELVEAAFDEYLHSEPPVSGRDIAKKYGLHPSTMNKRIALMRMSKDVARGGGDSGKKARSERAINLRSNPPSSRRKQEADAKPGSSSKSIPLPPPTVAVPTPTPTPTPATVMTIARGPKQDRIPANSKARADRINSAMRYIIHNPGQCYKFVAERFGVGQSTLFERAAKLRAAGINVPSSEPPGRIPAKQDTYITTGSSSRSRHEGVQVQQQRQQPSAGSAEEAISAVIRVRSSTSQRQRQDQGQGESHEQDPAEKKKSAPQPQSQSQSYQERERRRGLRLGLRSSSRIKAAAQTSVSAAVGSNSHSNTSTSDISRSKEKGNNDNPFDYMSRAERCEAAWQEYLCSNPRPKLLYFAEKYRIHKSTLSARRLAWKKRGVDVDLLVMNSAKAITNVNAIAHGAGSGRMTKAEVGAGVVMDLMSSSSDFDSDSDLEELEELEPESREAEAEKDYDEIIDVESTVTSPPSSRLTLTRCHSMQLSDIQERYLANWYLREESLGRGAPSRAKLTSMALSLLFDGQEAHLDLQDEEWLTVLIERFLERNPDIKSMVGRAEGEDGVWGEEVVGLVPAPKMRKLEDGMRMLWEPSAAEAAAAAAAMSYISEEEEEEDDEGDWDDEEESDSEQSESDESTSDSEDSEEDDSDTGSDTSTNTSNDDLYNQAFVESLFVKLESTPSPPSPSPPAATESRHEDNNLPTPQSSHDIQLHYLSALHDSQSATQTAQIVKTLCIKAGKALDLKNCALEALREKADRLEREVGELKKAIVEITAAAGKDDGLLSPSPGPASSPPPGLLSFEERHEQEQEQQQQQEGWEGRTSSSLGSMNMSSASNVDADRENVERAATTTTTTDKGLSVSSSSIIPLPGLEEANPMQESLRSGGGSEATSQESGVSEESEESESESDHGNEHKGSDTQRPSLTDTSTTVSHCKNRKRRLVDIEIVLEARRMFGFDHCESIGPWPGAYTIGPRPGKKRRMITERNSQGVLSAWPR